MKRVLVTGAAGQLGFELSRTVPEGVEVVSLTRDALDITQIESVTEVFNKYQFDAVINAAAYTAVDKAETDQEAAYAVNVTGTENLARACAEHDCYFVQVSTDFVFDGQESSPYQTDTLKKPLGVYGETKALAEDKVLEIVPENSAIVRTAWVYSSHGSNFVKSMLRLMAERDKLGIVYDQVGTPTWAKGLALTLWKMVEKRSNGVFHWTDAGVTSWYDFAVAISRLGRQKGLLEKDIPILPIKAEQYPTPAKRPSYSVLDKAKTYEALPEIEIKHWEAQLSSMLDELK